MPEVLLPCLSLASIPKNEQGPAPCPDGGRGSQPCTEHAKSRRCSWSWQDGGRLGARLTTTWKSELLATTSVAVYSSRRQSNSSIMVPYTWGGGGRGGRGRV